MGTLTSACLDRWAAPIATQKAPTPPNLQGAEEMQDEQAPSAVDSTEDTQALRVGAFNIRRLGLEPGTDIALVSELIESNFDLVGVVEVMHTGNDTHAGYDALLNALGPGWAGQITDTKRPNLNTNFAEFYAVFRRAARVSVCDAFPNLTYHPDADGTRAQSDRADLFLREPAFGCYRVQDPETQRTGFDFVLGVYHARWGSGAVDDIAAEIVHLDKVFAHQRALHPEERDFLLVGDFNLDAGVLSKLVRAVPLVQEGGTTLNQRGGRSSNQRDHILALDLAHTQEFLGLAEVLDLRGAAGALPNYLTRVSDHLPVRALFDGSAIDDD